MSLKRDDQINHLNYHIIEQGAGEAVLLLHGFTGSSADWQPIMPQLAAQYRVLAVDVVGHGQSDSPAATERYSMAAVGADLVALLAELDADPAHLVGYSMGGRLALYMASHHPTAFRSLILESASPGPRDATEHQQRDRQDRRLAERIEREGIVAFVDLWEALPLWESQRTLPADVLQRQREARLQNSPQGLANSLRGMGTGVQPSLWDVLGHLSMPVQLIAGELDTKFVTINHEMQALTPNTRLNVISGAGHNTHLEQPEAFLRVLLDFLQEIQRT
jgi:2-succinyl-6-hydroxy-2,4-cyclohexadiene-1-carboxylate synthase